jgi:tetratricopeptide (TPR) repeat protein
MTTGLRIRMAIGEAVAGKSLASLLTYLLIALFLPLTQAQTTHKTVRHVRVEDVDPDAQALAQAESAIEKQDYPGAEAQLKKFVEEHPEHYAAWYDLGFVYHALGNRDEEIAAYRKSVASKPEVFESNLNLGLALADKGQPEAEQFLRSATKLKPTSNPAQGQKRAWMALARVLETTKPDDALNALQQASVVDSKDPEPHLLAGSLLEKQQQAPEAEKEFKAALAVAPNSDDALIALTNLYMGQHRFADAESLLRRLAVQRPNDAGVHLQLGRMLAATGKTDDAIGELEAGLKIDPMDVNAQRDLADLYTDAAKYAQARQLYLALLKRTPGDASLHYNFGRALVKQKKFAEAEQQFAAAVQIKPDYGEAYGELAVVANENKDYPTVIKAAELRDKYLPEIPISYFLRATAYDHLRDVKQATRYYHQFLDTAGGKYPEQEWQARHRLIALEPKK